jgi:hypothetical protein
VTKVDDVNKSDSMVGGRYYRLTENDVKIMKENRTITYTQINKRVDDSLDLSKSSDEGNVKEVKEIEKVVE